jgi:hypothetical protein
MILMAGPRAAHGLCVHRFTLVRRIGCFFVFAQEKESTMLPLTFTLLTIGAADPLWHDDYAKATNAAMKEKKDLIIHFYGQESLDKALDSAAVKKKLEKFVCLRVPVDYKFQDKKLLDYPVLGDMRGKPGLVVVSYHDPKLETFGCLISVHPLIGTRYHWVPAYGADQVLVTLSLPAKSTLTQRSLIYAIRVHPEVPQSVYSECHPAFMQHAEAHCRRQAGMQYQHHGDLIAVSNWLRTQGAAFNGASEVVAESWGHFVGGENVMEGSFACVDAWRHSSSHWGAVAGTHSYFGYDICQGRDGTWYACGIFAK